jgi:hypothetical protein
MIIREAKIENGGWKIAIFYPLSSILNSFGINEWQK